MKYLFEIILEDELYDLKKENRIKESLIKIANDEVENLKKENQYKISTIQYCNEEILKEIKINAELTKEKKRLFIELEETKTLLKNEKENSENLEIIKNNLEKKLEICESSLKEERQQKAELEKINKILEDTFSSLSSEIKKLDTLNKDLNTILKTKESEILLLTAELKVQRDHVDDIQYKMRNLKDELKESEIKYLNEKQLKIKVEKQKETILRNLTDLTIELETSRKNESNSNDLRKLAESELNKLKIDYDDSLKQHESMVNSLKKRHHDTVEEMSRQIEQLFKAKTKLEKERLEQSKNYQINKEEKTSLNYENPLNNDDKFNLEVRRQTSIRNRFKMN